MRTAGEKTAELTLRVETCHSYGETEELLYVEVDGKCHEFSGPALTEIARGLLMTTPIDGGKDTLWDLLFNGAIRNEEMLESTLGPDTWKEYDLDE